MLCPQTKEKCKESNDPNDGCPWWIVLTTNAEQVGKCAITWITTLLIENRIAIDRLNPNIKKEESQKVEVKRKARVKK